MKEAERNMNKTNLFLVMLVGSGRNAYHCSRLGKATLFLQRVTREQILGFVGHTIFISATQLCPCSTKAAKHNMH